jgi:hypothetical protein
MKTTEKKLPDKDIMQTVISCLKLTPYAFGKKLDYKSTMSIYNVLAGTKQISNDMINRISIHYPEVNYLFLTTGEGIPLRNATEAEMHRNLFNSQEEISKVLWTEFAAIPARLLRIEEHQEEILKLLQKKE